MPDGQSTTPPEVVPEVVNVSSRDVSCDGGDGAYGHPKVYLKIAGDRVTCPYCSRMFVLAPGAVDHGH
jgi:uncharacterized Zn-finger protein